MMLFVLLLVSGSFIGALGNEGCGHFDYSEGELGPANWAAMCPTCGGDRQSPINIVIPSLKTITASSFKSPPIVFSDAYFKQMMKGSMVNNGHSFQFTPKDASAFTISGSELNGTYQFSQLHFHWGSNNKQGSEHTIDGARFPLEMHLVHTNTKYLDDSAKALENDDGLLVIGFLFEISNKNAVDKLVKVNKKGNPRVGFKRFFKMVKSNDFYAYSGSLTTPPCSQVVTWVVMKEPLPVSDKQMALFRSPMTETDEPLVDNFRPVQPLNDRPVFLVVDDSAAG